MYRTYSRINILYPLVVRYVTKVTQIRADEIIDSVGLLSHDMTQ